MAKTLTGVVSSDRADKTIVVTVRTRKTHPIYKKQYTVSKKFMAHDEQNEAKLGDQVIISETRPMSARKRFMLHKVVERAAIRHEEESFELPQDKPTEVPHTKPSAKKTKESPVKAKPETAESTQSMGEKT